MKSAARKLAWTSSASSTRLNWTEGDESRRSAAVREKTSALCEGERSATPATSSIRSATSTRSDVLRRSWPKKLVKDGRARAGHQRHGRPAAGRMRRKNSSRRCAMRSASRSTCTPMTPAASTPAQHPPNASRRRREHRRRGDRLNVSARPASRTSTAIVAALQHTPRDTMLELRFAQSASATTGNSVRTHYYPFEEDIKTGSAEVYQHEMPGGQFTNLKQQAKGLGLEHRWQRGGWPPTPRSTNCSAISSRLRRASKVVGDMALFMVTNDLSVERRPGREAESCQFPEERCRDDARPTSASLRAAGRGWFRRSSSTRRGEKPLKGNALGATPEGDRPEARRASELRRRSSATPPTDHRPA